MPVTASLVSSTAAQPQPSQSQAHAPPPSPGSLPPPQSQPTAQLQSHPQQDSLSAHQNAIGPLLLQMLRSTGFYHLDSDVQQDGAHGVGYSLLFSSPSRHGDFYLDVGKFAEALHAKTEQRTQLNNLTVAEWAHLWRASHDLD